MAVQKIPRKKRLQGRRPRPGGIPAPKFLSKMIVK